MLLLGKNKAIIDDFFMILDDDFEMQTSSMRDLDITSHIRYFQPDVVVCCLQNEAVNAANVLVGFKSKLEYDNIPLILIGNQEECDTFQENAYKMSDLILIKPVSIRNIRNSIQDFFENKTVKQEELVESDEMTKVLDIIKEMVDLQDESKVKGSSKVKKDVQKEVSEKKHILVVDDDPMMLKLVKEQLKDNYAVGTAISGRLALKFLENKKTDLIILDYEMPEENGAQVLEKIRANEETAKIPVIFLTGINDRAKIEQVLELKPRGYLLKPIEREKLLKIIAKNIK